MTYKRLHINARELRKGDRLRGLTEVVEVTSNWGVIYAHVADQAHPVVFNHGDPVDVDRPAGGDWRDHLVSVDSLTAGDAYRIFQALCTEVRRLDSLARDGRRGSYTEALRHTEALRDTFARLIP